MLSESSTRLLGYCLLIKKLEKMKEVGPVALFRKLYCLRNTQKTRLLGLDVGQKYVGLAVSDVTNQSTLPLRYLNFRLRVLLSVSLFNLMGQISVEAVQIRLFMKELCKTGKLDGLTYTYWDESYTSKCVEALLEPLNLHPVESKTIVDKFAAVGILQGYLDNMNRDLRSGKITTE